MKAFRKDMGVRARVNTMRGDRQELVIPQGTLGRIGASLETSSLVYWDIEPQYEGDRLCSRHWNHELERVE